MASVPLLVEGLLFGGPLLARLAALCLAAALTEFGALPVSFSGDSIGVGFIWSVTVDVYIAAPASRAFRFGTRRAIRSVTANRNKAGGVVADRLRMARRK